MALDVIVRSTDPDLTTTASLRALVLGATATSTAYDTQFSALIRAGSRAFEAFVGYPAPVQTYRETLPAYGRRRLMLSRTPLVAIPALYSATDTGDNAVVNTSQFIVEDREAGFLARNEGFAWTATLQWRSAQNAFGYGAGWGDAIPLNPEPLAGEEYKPWLVDYVAGWSYGGLSTSHASWSTVAGTTSTERTLPEDIEQGVLLWAQSQYVNPTNVASESLSDISVTYGSNVRSASDDETATPWGALWGPYRRVA